MSLIFDPRTSAIAAYMMNPMLYDASASSGTGNSVNTSTTTTVVSQPQLTTNSVMSNTTKLQQLQQHNNNLIMNQQQAFLAMAAAAQQAAAFNFLNTGNNTGNGSSQHGENRDKNLSESSLTNNKSSPGAPSATSGFRILDILDSSSALNISTNDNPEDVQNTLLTQNPTAQQILSVALQRLVKNGHDDSFLLNDEADFERLHQVESHRGTKRPYPSMPPSRLPEDGGHEDLRDDDCSVGESSPRSSATPNGSSLNGSMMNQLNGSAGNSTGGGSSGKKARKARTIFTDKQLQELEMNFDKHKYLSVQDRMDLAQRMGLSDTQVKTWYQNRRTKWKRQAAVGVDLLQEASNLAAVQNLIRTNPYWAQYMTNPFFAQRLMPLSGVNGGGVAGNLLASMGHGVFGGAGSFSSNLNPHPTQTNNLRRSDSFEENNNSGENAPSPPLTFSRKSETSDNSQTPQHSKEEENLEEISKTQQELFLNALNVSKKDLQNLSKEESTLQEENLEKNS